MIHSAKARRNYERNMTDRKARISQQLSRGTDDNFEYDPACDPRHAAFVRNKQAQESARVKPQEITAHNNVVSYERSSTSPEVIR
mgnify:CR=1 FL=1